MIYCKLFGCHLHSNWCCYFCEAHPSDKRFVSEPCWLVRMHIAIRNWIRWRLRGAAGKVCAHCGKRYWNNRDQFCCSKECSRDWVPF